MKTFHLLFLFLIPISVCAQNAQKASSSIIDRVRNQWIVSIANPIAAAKQDPFNLVAQAVGIYGVTATATAAHEFGHVGAAKLFRFPVQKVVLGRYENAKDNQALQRNKMQYGFGINPFKGACLMDVPSISSFATRYKVAAQAAAGPIAGIAANYMLDKAITIGSEYHKGQSLPNAVRIGMQKPAFSSENSTWCIKTMLLWNTLTEVCANLLPLHDAADGKKICDMLRIKPRWQSILQRTGIYGIGLSLPMSFLYIGNNMNGLYVSDKESGKIVKNRQCQ